MCLRGLCRWRRLSGLSPRVWTEAAPLVRISPHLRYLYRLLTLAESGPVLVSPTAIRDPQALSIKAIYNGETVQDGHTKDMIFTIRQQISHLSQGTTLEAGTIILTGTPAGIGYFRNPRVVLRDSDEINVEIGGIGTLVNKVHYDSC